MFLELKINTLKYNNIWKPKAFIKKFKSQHKLQLPTVVKFGKIDLLLYFFIQNLKFYHDKLSNDFNMDSPLWILLNKKFALN